MPGWRCRRRSARAPRSAPAAGPSATGRAPRRRGRRPGPRAPRRRRWRRRRRPGRWRPGGRPRTSRAISTDPDGDLRTKAGRRSSSTRTSSATRSAPGAPSAEYVSTFAAVRAAIAATRGSSALRTAVPAAGSASTSSALAAATSSIEPNSSVWAATTAVTTPTVGRATSQRRATWPLPLAPISMTAAFVPLGAFARVSGTPSSLLNERSLAAVGHRVAMAAAHRSFTEVLPTEPVMPTTSEPRRRRASRPMSRSAAEVSATSIRATPAGVSRRRWARVASAPPRERVGHEVVPVALGHDRHEELPTAHEPRVDGDAVDLHVGAFERARRGVGDVGGPHAHGRRSCQSPHAARRGRRPTAQRFVSAGSAGRDRPRCPWVASPLGSAPNLRRCPMPTGPASSSCSGGGPPSTRCRARRRSTCWPRSIAPVRRRARRHHA